MFRAIYEAAVGGVARINGTDGQLIYSESFDVRRGVIQGDIISPVLFTSQRWGSLIYGTPDIRRVASVLTYFAVFVITCGNSFSDMRSRNIVSGKLTHGNRNLTHDNQIPTHVIRT